MRNFKRQVKRVKDLKWQVVKATYLIELNGYDKKLQNRANFYYKQYEVALKRLKSM